METLHLHTGTQDVECAAQLLRDGQLVAIPTETVYGLAADARNAAAVESIFAAKGRPQDNPLIVHISSLHQLDGLVTDIPEIAQRLAAAFWPGPLTMIFKRDPSVPATVSAGLDTLAVRMPSHPTARALIAASGCPLAAPSANTSGRPSPTCAEHVLEDLNGRIAAVVDAGGCSVGLESTVIDVTCEPIRVYRPGAVTVEMLQSVVGQVQVSTAVTRGLQEGEKALSPGMKYKHYAPKAAVTVVKGSARAFAAFVARRAAEAGEGEVAALCFDDEQHLLSVPSVCYGARGDARAQARRLFDALRALDQTGAKTVYAACPQTKGVGLAVYNRLLRAAGFSLKKLPYIIGLTGPTGAGKSEVARYLNGHGCLHIDTDALARRAVEPGTACLQRLVDAFSADILNQDGTLNRGELARRAFADEQHHQLLNSIVHPCVIDMTWQAVDAAWQDFVLIDAPLLFESGMHRMCDVTVAVLSDKEERKRRVRERDDASERAIELRMSAQPEDDFYLQRADQLLLNDDTLETLHMRTDALMWTWREAVADA